MTAARARDIEGVARLRQASRTAHRYLETSRLRRPANEGPGGGGCMATGDGGDTAGLGGVFGSAVGAACGVIGVLVGVLCGVACGGLYAGFVVRMAYTCGSPMTMSYACFSEAQQCYAKTSEVKTLSSSGPATWDVRGPHQRWLQSPWNDDSCSSTSSAMSGRGVEQQGVGDSKHAICEVGALITTGDNRHLARLDQLVGETVE